MYRQWPIRLAPIRLNYNTIIEQETFEGKHTMQVGMIGLGRMGVTGPRDPQRHTDRLIGGSELNL